MSRRLVVEADGGSRGNPGPAAYGALVRDPATGEVLAEIAEEIGVATNNVAEYRGVIAGLQAAKEIDPSARVQVRLDSKLVVEQMSGRWKIKNAALKPLALEAHRVFPPGQVSYTWVPREQNTHADRLLNQALDGDPVLYTAAERAQPLPDLATATTLLLVRHGQTVDTIAKRFTGAGPGPPLDEEGREEATRAADALAGRGAVAVVTSPILRARQTAEPIAARLGLALSVDDDWRECDFGAWEGLTATEVAERFPDEFAAWRASTASAAPGGESVDQMTARVVAARDRVLERLTGQTVVVVTHSTPIRALVCLALDAPLASVRYVQPATGSLTELHTVGDGQTVLTGLSLRP